MFPETEAGLPDEPVAMRKGREMKGLTLRSRAGSLVCPLCEVDKLKARGHSSASCASCGGIVSGATLEALRQIIALPDALGATPASVATPRCGGCPMERSNARTVARRYFRSRSWEGRDASRQQRSTVFDGRTLGRRATEGRN